MYVCAKHAHGPNTTGNIHIVHAARYVAQAIFLHTSNAVLNSDWNSSKLQIEKLSLQHQQLAMVNFLLSLLFYLMLMLMLMSLLVKPGFH